MATREAIAVGGQGGSRTAPTRAGWGRGAIEASGDRLVEPGLNDGWVDAAVSEQSGFVPYILESCAASLAVLPRFLRSQVV